MKSSFLVYTSVFITTMHSNNFSSIIQICNGWQIFVSTAMVSGMIPHYDHLKIFTSIKMHILLAIFYLSIFLKLLNLHYQNNSVYVVASILHYLFLACILLLIICWTLNILYRSWFSQRIMKYDDYICLAFIIMAVIGSSAWITLENTSDNSMSSISSPYLAGDLLIRFFVIYFTSSFTKRVLKHQAQVNKLEAEFKTELVKYLSHEIRNPLNILAMSLEHVKLEVEKGNLGKEFISESITSLESGCCGALEVLNELVTYEEIEAGYFNLNKTECNPFTLVQEALQSLVEVIIPFGLHLHLSVSPEDRQHLGFLLMDADKEEIRMVLRKVISKCIFEYKSGDTIDVSLSISKAPVVPPRKSATQVVPNNSYGTFRICIPFPNVFSSFDAKYISEDELQFRREGCGDNNRLGLNIWLSRKIVTLHGGDMGLLGSPNAGSSIYIDLPCRKNFDEINEVHFQSKFDEPADVDDSNASSLVDLSLTAPASCSTVKYSGEKLHLLIVDDSSLNRKVIAKVMTSLGHTCDTVEDGSLAVERLKSIPFETYDAILME